MLILGFVFWSTSSRKFFTIPEAKSIKLSKNSDDISSTSRKSYPPSNCNKSQDQLAKKIIETQAEIRKFWELAVKRRLSASFISPFEKAYQCCLCKQIPADLPIVSPSSCSTLVGCEAYTVSSTEIALTKDVTNVEPHEALSKIFVFKEFDDLVPQIKIDSNQDDAYWQPSYWLKAESPKFHLKNFNFFSAKMEWNFAKVFMWEYGKDTKLIENIFWTKIFL